VTIEERDVDVADGGRRRTRQYFSHDGAAGDARIPASPVVFDRHLKPALGGERPPSGRTG
jgi:hypothetical protein